ncbi:hypothetical protein FF124_17690 [Martelella lutilitoris]|uniref:Uncharacterized protein n=1 Tax=Martelella lutilitoris TaxID=2583532 RepID=A0A5C4JME3_9HYPH|nr:hypothetical protein [Martelella lutilitoris]TNB46361.1 hypothetical protein FF124_17690 [Martelella lutilitoris]
MIVLAPFHLAVGIGLALTSLVIKNAVMLVEEIDAQKNEAGLPQREARHFPCLKQQASGKVDFAQVLSKSW